MDSKITVKHYLNKNLKPKIRNGQTEFPIYVQVIFKTKPYKFRSSNSFFEYLTEDALKEDLVNSFLKEERENITRVVTLIDKHNPKLLTSKNLSFLSKDLGLIIEENFKKILVKEIKDTPHLFKNASYTEMQEVLFFLRVMLDDSHEIQGNEKIHNILYGISKTGYPSMSFFKENYLGVDWFFGSKLNDLLDYIESEKNENEIKQLVKDMQEFIKM